MLRLLLALAVTVALGLASRLYPAGWFLWDRVLGEVLYAVAAYLALAMLLFRKPPLFIAVIAFALLPGGRVVQADGHSGRKPTRVFGAMVSGHDLFRGESRLLFHRRGADRIRGLVRPVVPSEARKIAGKLGIKLNESQTEPLSRPAAVRTI